MLSNVFHIPKLNQKYCFHQSAYYRMKLLSNLFSFVLCVSGPAHGDNDWEGKWKRRPVCLGCCTRYASSFNQFEYEWVLRWILRLEVICGSFGTEGLDIRVISDFWRWVVPFLCLVVSLSFSIKSICALHVSCLRVIGCLFLTVIVVVKSLFI